MPIYFGFILFERFLWPFLFRLQVEIASFLGRNWRKAEDRSTPDAGSPLSVCLSIATNRATGGLIGAMFASGVSQADPHVYAEGVQRGGSLFTAKMDESSF
jgi:hypothetical protein